MKTRVKSKGTQIELLVTSGGSKDTASEPEGAWSAHASLHASHGA